MTRIRFSELAENPNTGTRVRASRVALNTASSLDNRIRVSRLSMGSVGGGVVANAGTDVVSDALMQVILSSTGSTGTPASRTWAVQSVLVESTSLPYAQPPALGVFDLDAAQDPAGDFCYIRTPAAFVNLIITMSLVVTGTGGSSVDTVRVKVYAHNRWYSVSPGLLKPLAQRRATAHPAGVVLI